MQSQLLKWRKFVIVMCLTVSWLACDGGLHSKSTDGNFLKRSELSPQSQQSAPDAARESQPAIEDPVEVFFSPNSSGHSDFIKLVSSAQKSLNLAMFRLTDKDDAEALAAAAQRKVKVRVILDQEMLAANKNPQIRETLEAAGVEVKPSSKAFSITHEKAMTLDDSTAMISTVNLTNAYRTTRDVGVISHDPDVIREFNEVFEADWLNADQQTRETPPLSSLQLLWSPVNATDRLISLIQSAKTTIEVYVENFSSQEISQALIEAATRGVKIRVITPLCDENQNPLLNLPMMKALNAHGIEARLMKAPATAERPYIHAKSIVVDGAQSYVGSMNFSNNSLKNAREVGIRFFNSQASAQIQGKFNQDWKLAEAPPNSTDGLCSPTQQ
jgi:phosphatidylserine/phosphatidylglycerophosphate/cardiolipin synthase-like enzyme